MGIIKISTREELRLIVITSLYKNSTDLLNSQSPKMSGGALRVRWDYARRFVMDVELSDPYISAIYDFSRFMTPLPTDIFSWGDSMTYYNHQLSNINTDYPWVLSDLINVPTVWVENRGEGGHSSQQIHDKFVAASHLRDGIHIFWQGRNSANGWDMENRELIKGHIADQVTALTSNPKRFLVLTVCNGNYAGEFIGTQNYNNLMTLNNDLLSLYPDNSIDIRQVLINNGNGSQGDNDDIANGIPPGSLRRDNLHLNATGNAIVAQAVYNFLNAKGWLPA